MKLVVGLGNPGKKYEGTRHNVGFMAVDAFEREVRNWKLEVGEEVGGWKLEKRLQSAICHPPCAILAKPLVFMNETGVAVKKLIASYRLPITNLWVVHDDIDLPLGEIKIQIGGSSAGHKGVQSIIDCLGREDFVRIRLGIGRPEKTSNMPIEEFVLKKFNREERLVEEGMVKRAGEVIQLGLKEGIEKAREKC